MKKRIVISLALLFILVAALLVAPVAAAGLRVADGVKIAAIDAATSPEITITDAKIAQDGTIVINVTDLNAYVANGTFTDANVEITSNATNATWTRVVADGNLTLTSTGGNTTVGETVTLTFTGAAGNTWVADTGGNKTVSLTAIRNDGLGQGSFNFVIETVPPPAGGLTITDGAKITTRTGNTSPVIMITGSDIAKNDTINIDVTFLQYVINSGILTNENIVVNDTAVKATWTGALEFDVNTYTYILTLTSTGGNTTVGETVTVTFTGAGGNPWIPDTSFGEGIPVEFSTTSTAIRTDTGAAAPFTFVIETALGPGGLTVTDGAKINTTKGATSVVITITDAPILQYDTIIIYVGDLNGIVANGTFTNANIVVKDTAVNATWTGTLASDYLTLKSNGGATAVNETVTVTFTGAGGNPWILNTIGERIVPLTATRIDNYGSGGFNFVIEITPPPSLTVAANFTASPTKDMAPLTVTFADTSLGGPTSWSWDFGDGATSVSRNPVHTYADVGTYTVSLTATNAYGSDTKTQWNYINVLNSAVREANTAIPGLTITNCGSQAQTITVNTSILPAVLISKSVLEIQPPPDRGFKNIIMNAPSGVGFSREGNQITGSPTSVHLVSEDIAPSPGFSGNIGTNASFNYSIDLSSYPCNAKLITKILEGVIKEDEEKFNWVASNNSAAPIGTAYTAKITKTNFPADTPVKVHMSVNSSWKRQLSGGPGLMFIWRIADDGNSGQILPTTRYLNTDPVNNLDYFEADSPLGGSTFGISSLTGSNNPFQIIGFVAAAAINQPDNPGPASGGSSGGGKAVVVPTTIAPETKQAAPPDPGKTARIYTNDKGTITQAMTLKSTDGLANVSIGLGIVAKNSSGMPLTSISITRIPDLPAAPTGEALSFAGMAYELQPDGATFSPSVSLSFTIPQEQWGKEYVIHEYDHATDTWLDLPSRNDPQTGTITVQISHLCCFALFAKSTGLQKAENPGPTLVVTPEKTIIVSSKSSLSTNFEMYGWILSMIVDNPVTLVIMLAALAMVAYFGWWKRRL